MPRRRTISFSKNTISQLFFSIGETLKKDSEESKLLYSKISKGVNPEHKLSFESTTSFDNNISESSRISFSKNTLSKSFFLIGEIIKENSEDSKLLYNKILEGVDPEHKTSFEFPNFFGKDLSESTIRTILEGYGIEQLKETIKGLSLDSNRHTAKWKDKDKLIKFIIEARKHLMAKFG